MATAAHPMVRLAGTASAFQIPPSDRAVPTGPSHGSDRRPNASTPAAADVVGASEMEAVSNHGSVLRSQSARTATVGRRPIGRATSAVARVMTARTEPVGVKPATANSPPS